MSRTYSVDLKTIVESHNLTPVNLSDDYEQVKITTWDVTRPGLPFAGFYDYFDPTRVQIMGKLEATYLKDMAPEARLASIRRYMSTGVRFLVVAHGMPVPPEMLEEARRNNVCLFTTEQSTSDFMAQLIVSLNIWLAPRTTVHGVLMADDAVEVKRTSRDTLIGYAPEVIRYFMEVRGIGLVDARHMFGIGAVKPEQVIDLVVRFELWDKNKHYDRLGIDTQYTEILGVQVPYNVIPVRPGRNLDAILELAAMNNRERKTGYNAARILVDRHDQLIDEGMVDDG